MKRFALFRGIQVMLLAVALLLVAMPRPVKAADGQNTQAAIDIAGAILNSPAAQMAVSPLPMGGFFLAIASMIFGLFSDHRHGKAIAACNSRVDDHLNSHAESGGISPTS